MRLTKDTKAKVIRKLCALALPEHQFLEDAKQVVEYVEKTIPFQRAVKALADYPEYVAKRNTVTFSLWVEMGRMYTERSITAYTSVPYAGRFSGKETGYLRYASEIIFHVSRDGVITVTGMFDDETEVSDELSDLTRPLFQKLIARADFEKGLHELFYATDSLGKILAVLTPLKKVFPDEKVYKLTDTEKKLLMPNGLEFVLKRLENLDLNPDVLR